MTMSQAKPNAFPILTLSNIVAIKISLQHIIIYEQFVLNDKLDICICNISTIYPFTFCALIISLNVNTKIYSNLYVKWYVVNNLCFS